MTATVETKTFPTRQLTSYHQLDQLAIGAYFVDGFGRGVVKSDETWYMHDDHEFEVSKQGVALPAEVLDEGDVPFQPGDRVRIVDNPFHVPVGAEGTVRQYNGVYWAVIVEGHPNGVNGDSSWPFAASEIEKIEDAPAETIEVGDIVRITSTHWDNTGAPIRSGLEGKVEVIGSPYFEVYFEDYGSTFPLREHEFVLVRKAEPMRDLINEFAHSFTIELAEIAPELLNLILGAPIASNPEVGALVETTNQLNALPNGAVLVTEARGLRLVQLP